LLEVKKIVWIIIHLNFETMSNYVQEMLFFLNKEKLDRILANQSQKPLDGLSLKLGIDGEGKVFIDVAPYYNEKVIGGSGNGDDEDGEKAIPTPPGAHNN
jgi:hypothetical protein